MRLTRSEELELEENFCFWGRKLPTYVGAETGLELSDHFRLLTPAGHDGVPALLGRCWKSNLIGLYHETPMGAGCIIEVPSCSFATGYLV